jgi:hypothetical protein
MKAFARLFLFGTMALLVFATAAAAADKSPERHVHGSTITSSHDPAVEIRLPRSAKYVGAARWDLYGICDAELHVFVEADPHRQVQRLYWIQFEGYLPDNHHQYAYPFTETTVHGGQVFDVNASFGPTNKPSRAGSDRERVLALIEQAGYHLPPEQVNVRLVNMLDDLRRKELMFIYLEDAALSGMTLEQLDGPDGKARWETLKAGLIERAKQRIKLKGLDDLLERALPAHVQD